MTHNPTEVQNQLQQAISHHKTGDFDSAEAHYRKVLELEPSHYNTLANLGTIKLLQGAWQEAETLLNQAVQVNSTNAEILHNLGVALKEQEKVEQALGYYQQAIALKPDYLEAYQNLGIAYINENKLLEAEAAFQKAALISPNNPEIYHDLGVIKFKQNELDEAIKYYQQALHLNPNYPQALNNLGITFKAQKRFPEAILYFQKVVSLAPNYPEAYQALGACLSAIGKTDEAISVFQKLIALKPGHAEAFHNLGVVYYKQGRYEQARTALQRAIAIQPDYPEACSHLGLTFKELQCLDQAMFSCQQAISLNPASPVGYSNLGLIHLAKDELDLAETYLKQALLLHFDFPEAHHNLGLTYHCQGRLPEAIACYRQALEQQFQYPQAHLGLAIASMLVNDYHSGWVEYEWRLQLKENKSLIPAIPRWEGDFTENHTELLLVEEQGIGDILQFIRYASLLKEHFPLVTLAVREPLHGLIEASGLFDKVYALPTTQLTISEHSKWLPILSLLGLLNLSKDEPVVQAPYIRVQPDLFEKWHDRIKSPDKLTIGLNWQGNPETEKDDFRGRSFPLATYEPLASIPGLQFVSLQKGYGSEQLESCTFTSQFVPCQEEINQTWDWMDTAAIIQACDLIITSDTSIAHLAGAMGKPVWILLKKVPDWRWGLEGQSSLWYPSARLFRQVHSNDWAEVIGRVKGELAKLKQ